MKTAFGCALAVAVSSVAVSAQVPVPATESRPVVLQRVLVKVNGAIFTKTELETQQITALRDQNQRELSQMDLENDASLRDALLDITPQILFDSVDRLILVQRGRELGLSMTEAQFDSMVESVMQENQIPDEATFQAALVQQGLTMDQLRKNFEYIYLQQGVMQTDVQPRITVTDEEARQYYLAHPEDFMTPTMVTIREISVLVPTETRLGQPVVNVAAEEAAQAKIDAIRERAANGEDFEALVTEFSESGSKANGGLIGPLNLNELAEGLQALLRPLKTGDIAEPLRTAVGFQLLKVEAKSDESVEPFEKVRLQVANLVQGERSQSEMLKFIESLRDQAIIEWKDDDLKKLYEQFRAEQAKRDQQIKRDS